MSPRRRTSDTASRRASLATRAPGALACACALQVAGCAATGEIESPSDIVDSGRTNVAVLDYDVTIDVGNRHPEARIVVASLCPGGGDDSSALLRRVSGNDCVEIPARHVGRAESANGIALERFALREAVVRRMKYGEYVFDRLTYKVLAHREVVSRCSERKLLSGKVGVSRTSCESLNDDDFLAYSVRLPRPIAFRIVAGSGCFLGNVSLHVEGETVRSYGFASDIDAMDIDQLPDRMHERIGSHVSRACADA